MLLGWYIHYLSHAYDLLLMYENSTNSVIKYIQSNETLDSIFRNIIYYTIDFHDKIHHDTSINKQNLI